MLAPPGTESGDQAADFELRVHQCTKVDEHDLHCLHTKSDLIGAGQHLEPALKAQMADCRATSANLLTRILKSASPAMCSTGLRIKVPLRQCTCQVWGADIRN